MGSKVQEHMSHNAVAGTIMYSMSKMCTTFAISSQSFQVLTGRYPSKKYSGLA